jgi:hypothetical protein
VLLTKLQAEFIDAVNNAGGVAEVAYGIDQAVKILERWGVLRGKVQ